MVTRWNGWAMAPGIGMLLACLTVACSADDGPSTVADGTGGPSPSGGSSVGIGGATGSGGAGLGTGGGFGTSGALVGTGGNPPGTGGYGNGTGGSLPGTGGSLPGTGGSQVGTGGNPPTTGGAFGTGGVPQSTGGALPTTGGNPGTGGADPGTGGLGTGGAPVDPNASAAIHACMDQLPWGARDMSEAERAPIVAAIINTCAEFAPPGAEWQGYCQMFLVTAINKESSYNTQSVVEDAYGGAADPTVGLLQIRFSSTVREFADNGPIDALTRIGCNFGTVTSGDSWATKRDMMLDPACNVALGAWYYFVYGSGNGGADVVYVYQYCQGGGTTGNLHIGMASHLMGAQGAHDNLSGADAYYDEIKSWFDPCVTYTGTHPFERSIQPDTARYCG